MGKALKQKIDDIEDEMDFCKKEHHHGNNPDENKQKYFDLKQQKRELYDKKKEIDQKKKEKKKECDWAEDEEYAKLKEEYKQRIKEAHDAWKAQRYHTSASLRD